MKRKILIVASLLALSVNVFASDKTSNSDKTSKRDGWFIGVGTGSQRDNTGFKGDRGVDPKSEIQKAKYTSVQVGVYIDNFRIALNHTTTNRDKSNREVFYTHNYSTGGKLSYLFNNSSSFTPMISIEAGKKKSSFDRLDVENNGRYVGVGTGLLYAFTEHIDFELNIDYRRYGKEAAGRTYRLMWKPNGSFDRKVPGSIIAVDSVLMGVSLNYNF